MTGSTDVRLVPAADVPHLAEEWRRLEVSAEGSPFTSWAWVRTWLDTLPAHYRPLVFRAEDDYGTLGLGVFIESRSPGLRGWFGGRMLRLQESGRKDLDDLTIEYVGLVARPGHEREAYTALFAAIEARQGRWDGLRISATTQGVPIQAALPESIRALCLQERPSYYVDLAGVRDRQSTYMASLSRSTRYELRRTVKAFSSMGDIRVDVARDVETALAYLAELRRLHALYWQGRGMPGAFGSDYFRRFHEAFVAGQLESGVPEIVRVRAGEQVIGYQYNLIWQNDVHLYASGLNYGMLTRRDRPGFAVLAAIIEHYLQEGRRRFDFLAGDAHYKRMLSTHERRVLWLEIGPTGWRQKVDRALAIARGRATALPLTAERAERAAVIKVSSRASNRGPESSQTTS